MTDPDPDPDSIRLSKRVAGQLQCSRSSAERLIEAGLVRVQGRLIQTPGARVLPQQCVSVEPGADQARLPDPAPLTLLLHKPAGFETGPGGAIGPGPADGAHAGCATQHETGHGARGQGHGDDRRAGSRPGAATPRGQPHGPARDRPAQRRPGLQAPQATALLRADALLPGPPGPASIAHVRAHQLRRLVCLTPLPTAASGLVVYTQQRGIARKLLEHMAGLENECIVQTAGTIAADGLQRLRNGLRIAGRVLPPVKASWQNETRLRLALKGLDPGRIPALCAALGLTVHAVHRIRIGRIPLSPLPEGAWRCVQPWERF